MNKEFNSFGPWIYEISESTPMPPLFEPHISRDKTPLLSIKIPGKIERRNAKPGMNLYDYVVNLYKEDLLILERAGNKVKINSFHYEKIESLSLMKDLLQGNLCIVMDNNIYNLPMKRHEIRILMF